MNEQIKRIITEIRKFEKLSWWKRWRLRGWARFALKCGRKEEEIISAYKAQR